MGCEVTSIRGGDIIIHYMHTITQFNEILDNVKVKFSPKRGVELIKDCIQYISILGGWGLHMGIRG